MVRIVPWRVIGSFSVKLDPPSRTYVFEALSSTEVENAMYQHEAVAECAVIGIPDEKWGEAVKAIIVPKEGTDPSPDSIIAWARERIAGYKCPKSVDYIQEMPRNPSGKILRKDLREPYWEGQERRVGG